MGLRVGVGVAGRGRANLLEEGAVALGHNRDRPPRAPRPRGASYAVDVGLHLGWEIVVDDGLH